MMSKDAFRGPLRIFSIPDSIPGRPNFVEVLSPSMPCGIFSDLFLCHIFDSNKNLFNFYQRSILHVKRKLKRKVTFYVSLQKSKYVFMETNLRVLQILEKKVLMYCKKSIKFMGWKPRSHLKRMNGSPRFPIVHPRFHKVKTGKKETYIYLSQCNPTVRLQKWITP